MGRQRGLQVRRSTSRSRRSAVSQGARCSSRSRRRRSRSTGVGVPLPDVIYDIARFSDGEIPEDLALRAEGSRAHRHDVPRASRRDSSASSAADFDPVSSYSVGATCSAPSAASTRTEWVNTDQVEWNQGVMLHRRRCGRCATCVRTLRARVGLTRPALRRRSCARTSVPATGRRCAQGDYAQVNVPSWADGGEPAAHRCVRHLRPDRRPFSSSPTCGSTASCARRCRGSRRQRLRPPRRRAATGAS